VRLIQFATPDGATCAGIVHDRNTVEKLKTYNTIYALARAAINCGVKLEILAESHRSGELVQYHRVIDEGRLLPPLLHPDPAHLLVSGTGLTHLGSAAARAAMHTRLQNKKDEELTDSMKMFRMGVEGGKPSAGKAGVQPEWFYKGDGAAIVAPGQAVPSPAFALDLGDEAEIVGLYVIGDDGKAYRVGFALGNEYSDHRTERMNYLYLAHSKLRHCAFGPEILLGELPAHVQGTSRVIRDGKIIWEKEFLSGEANMSHTVTNLEYHHFKYRSFLRPGDVHVHYFGTGTLSFADGVETRPGDVFELESALFGRPLRNQYQVEASITDYTRPVIPL
jgi:hypothetical protein